MNTILFELLSLQGKEFVLRAYQLILGRDADQAGLKHYMEWLEQGRSQADVMRSIFTSREAEHFRNLDDIAGPDETFIDEAYRRLLGRSCDPVGRSYFLGRLKRGVGRKSILRDMRKSAESKHYSINIFLRMLDEYLRIDRRAKGPFGWLFSARQNEFHFRQIAWSIGEIMTRVDAILKEAREPLISHDSHTDVSNFRNVPQTVPSPLLSDRNYISLTPRAHEIYRQLDSAIHGK
jgi:hypothetical protein